MLDFGLVSAQTFKQQVHANGQKINLEIQCMTCKVKLLPGPLSPYWFKIAENGLRKPDKIL